MKSYDEFKQAIRKRESGDNYACVNRFGYLGAYQFGLARLCDLGLARRKANRLGMANSCFEFVPPMDMEMFLSSSILQDALFDRHVGDLVERIKLTYFGDNLSGAVAACHLMGYQAFLDYVHRGKEKSDGLGTPISEYFETFRGYLVDQRECQDTKHA